MKNKIISLIFLIGIIFFINLISAESEFFVSQNEDYCIKFSCETNGFFCSGSSLCNISINYPNSSSLIDNQQATNLNNGYFQYCLNENQTATKGEYFSRVGC